MRCDGEHDQRPVSSARAAFDRQRKGVPGNDTPFFPESVGQVKLA